MKRNSYNLSPGDGILFRFRLEENSYNGAIGLQGANGKHVRLGLYYNTIRAGYNNGTGDVNLYSLPQTADSWYWGEITISKDGAPSWRVWNEDDPNSAFAFTAPPQSALSSGSYRFFVQVDESALYLSRYRESEIAVTEYGYDLRNSLTDVYDALYNPAQPTKHHTTISYNVLGQKMGMDDPDMGVWSYAYNPSGELIEQKDANGDYLCFYYDTAGRLTDKRHRTNACPTGNSGGTLLAHYNYYSSGDGVGLLSSVAGGSGTGAFSDSYSYDKRGRITSQTRVINGESFTLQTTAYDLLNRPLSMIYPDGNILNGPIVQMSYEGMFPETLETQAGLFGSNTTLVSQMNHNKRGQLTQFTRGNGIVTTNSYYPASDNFRLERVKHGSLGGSLPDFEYDYDAIGNVEGLTERYKSVTQLQSFEYDDLNRLTSASASKVQVNSSDWIPGYTASYSYDPLGNMITRNIFQDDGTQSSNNNYSYSYHADKHHAVMSVTGGSNPANFVYDDNGNMKDRQMNGKSYTQNFDAENRLISVVGTGKPIPTTTFYYDADGNRTLTITPDGHKRYTPFPMYEVEKWTDCSGIICNDFEVHRATYMIGGQAIATKISGDPVPSNNGIFYFYNDQLGSVTSMSNASNGATVSGTISRYLPFGDWRTEPTAGLTDRGYTGHKHNNLGGGANDLGLIYMNARYYVPSLARFASADTIVPNPASPQSFNRFSYVLNSPHNYIDISGHIPKRCPKTEPSCKLYSSWKFANRKSTNDQNNYNDVIHQAVKHAIANTGWTNVEARGGGGHDQLFIARMIKRIIAIESRFNPRALNTISNATGLMQILPSNFPSKLNTFEGKRLEVLSGLKLKHFNPYNPEHNIAYGTALLFRNYEQLAFETNSLIGSLAVDGYELWKFTVAAYHSGMDYVLQGISDCVSANQDCTSWDVVESFFCSVPGHNSCVNGRDPYIHAVFQDWFITPDSSLKDYYDNSRRNISGSM